ncbi:MAG: magnesium transporter CorA family protein [Clostridiales bacterium]|nr:magnesium transporter CorA family protein [Clostridiales bacterium]
MLSVYAMEPGKRELVECKGIEKGCWINLENPSDLEIELVSSYTSIPEDMLKAALDEEERAHIDIDGDCTLIVIDIPVINEEKGTYVYSTLPLAIIQTPDYFVTVCLRETSIIADFTCNSVRNFDVNKRTRFIYQILYIDATKFLHCLKLIDRQANHIQQSLHRSLKNTELIKLLELDKSLVYFSTSLNANQIVIDRIKQMSSIKHYEDDNDLLDDVIIENKQAIEMASIHREVLSGTMDAFASVISNNQNIVMKLLTAITILLTIPTLISGLWGMNVIVPLNNNPYAFWIIIGIIAAIIIPVTIIMLKKKMF